jgi:hypothetical protein
MNMGFYTYSLFTPSQNLGRKTNVLDGAILTHQQKTKGQQLYYSIVALDLV